MILDKENLFSEDQAVTVTAASSNVIDLQGANGGDMSPGEPLEILAQVTAAFTAGGSATLTVALQSDDAEGFGTVVTHLTTPAIAVADLVEGYRLPFSMIPEGLGRYVRLNYTVATGPMTAGTIMAGIVPDKQS